jgi:hypothetical protein
MVMFNLKAVKNSKI